MRATYQKWPVSRLIKMKVLLQRIADRKNGVAMISCLRFAAFFGGNAEDPRIAP